ncbi:MAG: lysine--tRNA ligase [Acidimicrobiales bacterium]|nr:lysine--tRNA ligase [Acidimicrobiales bacterium]
MIPYKFETTTSIGDIVEKYQDKLEAGENSGEVVSIAGRLMLSRPQGKLFFGTLESWNGKIQLFALEKTAANFEELVKLSLGDWIGVHGEVVRTKRGELSVQVESWELLAQARRGFGDKWKGISDPELRFRHREVDLWANEAPREVALKRARIISFIRRFLEKDGFVEVETPVLHPIPGGAHAEPFTTHHRALDMDLYLRIAPELYLKRLVVGGFEKVFEIGRVFRNEGLSTRHNPEFTLLELYQAYADYRDLMVLMENLVANLSIEINGTTKISYGGRELDLTPPWRRATMVELIEEVAGLTVSVHTPLDQLRSIAENFNIPVNESWGSGKVLLEIYEKTTESALFGPIFVCDYPAEVSPLARKHRDDPLLVERFEPIVAGRELGNCFSELIDPDDQRERFEAQAQERAAGDDEAMMLDENYLQALEYGLPPTAGLGIGIDRLVMLLTDTPTIRDVVLFPTLRPLGQSGS